MQSRGKVRNPSMVVYGARCVQKAFSYGIYGNGMLGRKHRPYQGNEYCSKANDFHTESTVFGLSSDMMTRNVD